jgi:C_GCAxxG_C_C family probable redox protein
MNRADQSVQLFEQGFSCSQAILATYGPPLGLDRDIALKAAAGFGGGIGCMGTLCGALGGLFIAIGLKYGTTDPSDKDTKMKTYEIVKNAAEQFEKQYGSVNCRDLLGFDLSTPQGKEQAKKSGSFDICPNLIRCAAQIAEETLDVT